MVDRIIGAEVFAYRPADGKCVEGGEVSYASAAEG